eukprot:15195487-Heterocapsa_arctica.AAC.1
MDRAPRIPGQPEVTGEPEPAPQDGAGEERQREKARARAEGPRVPNPEGASKDGGALELGP